MNNNEDQVMNLLAYTMVNFVDEIGKGVELMEELGEEGFDEIMKAYRAHEASTEQE